jgi:hypothetical protein
VLIVHALVPDRLDDQCGGGSAFCPRKTRFVHVVVDPGQRAVARVLGDRVDLPVRGPGAHAPVERQVGQLPGEAEEVREVFVGGLLPTAGPHQLVAAGEALQVGRTARRYVVQDPVDGMQASRRAALERRIAGRQPVPFPEPEEADDSVDVEE